MYKCNLSKETEQEIIALYQEGCVQQKIADQYGVSKWKVSDILKQNGIQKRTKSQANSRYTCNEDFFSVIDTEEKAYWLGFLAADGFVNTDKGRWGVTLSATDKAHLEKLRNAIQGTHPINEFVVNKAKGYYSCRLHVVSDKMKDDLVSKGILEVKTDVLTFPTEDQVPKELIRHYMRGYFDGDGSIIYDKPRNRWKLCLLGTTEFLDGWMKECGLDYKIHDEKRSTVKYIQFGAREAIKNTLDFLYKDCSVCLERKYLKYKQAVESH